MGRSVAQTAFLTCLDRSAEKELHEDVTAPYTALLRQAVRTAAAPAQQPALPLGASLSENANP